MSIDEIRTAIITGKVDDYLPLVINACDARRKAMAQRTFDELNPGDRVKVSAAALKPKYIDGALATVVEKRVSKITVKFDDDIYDPYGKWAGKRAILPADALTKVSGEEAAA